MKPYKTLIDTASAELVVKKSRFISYAAPVQSDEQAVAFVASIRRKHSDARHNVYAYTLNEGQIKRYSDDGEPQGTAGMPVLDVLIKGELVDCAVVVTRYFGGVLLGTGGLVHAYSQTASLAVKEAKIGVMRPWVVFGLTCDYSFYGKISTLIQDYGGRLQESDFTDDVRLKLSIPEENKLQFREALTESGNGKWVPEELGYEFGF